MEALVRSGTVAREKARAVITTDISIGETKEVDAFLIEARSWGGESGSPVFAYTPSYSVGGRSFEQMLNEDEIYRSIQTMPVEMHFHPTLAGVLHGHFTIEHGGSNQNSGIGIVIPLKAVDEVLKKPFLVAQREAMIQRMLASRRLPTPD